MSEFQPLPRLQECIKPQEEDTVTESTAIYESEDEHIDSVRRPPKRPPAIPLRGVVQHYAWGKPSETSIVAHMATEQVRASQGPMKAPPMSRGNKFAELWMGTHPNGHSSVILPQRRGDPGPDLLRKPFSKPYNVSRRLMQIQEDSSISSDEEETHEWFLGDIIEQDPTFWLGKEEARRKNIPFLLKVLSVRQALSIQAHPNKQLAEELHRTCPGHYPDGNHKPEICIPLGHFEALCGFRPTADVRRHVSEVPELRRLVQLEEEEIAFASLQDMFSRLMKADAVQQTNQVVALVNRLKETLDPDRDEKLILRISQDYPMDVGIFSVYFLNYVVITEDMPNRFIYCAPDEPHAYLCGDAVECMAMSDNVVRAGLTQKFKDVDTLLRMMTWRDDLLDELVNVGERVEDHVVRYNPPVDDFTVYEVDGPVPNGIVLERASIVACISGSFVVDFRSLAPKDGGNPDDEITDFFASADVPFSWRGEKNIIKGNTFFSRAGSELIVKSAREKSKLFIATY